MKTKITLLKLHFLLFSFLTINVASTQNLLWTSSLGGENNNGAIVNYSTSSGQVESIISLDGNPLAPYNPFDAEFAPSYGDSDFYYELGGLMVGSDGYIYGVEHHAGPAYRDYNGSAELGMLYRFLPGVNKIEVLYAFSGSHYLFNQNVNEGALQNGYSKPRLGIIEAQPGILYGICIEGGSENKGGIWKFEISTGTFTQLGDFTENGIGHDPTSALFVGSGDYLYGVVKQKGGDDGGHLYRLDIASGTLSYVDELAGAGTAIFDPIGKAFYDLPTNRIYGVKRIEITDTGGGVYYYDFNSGDVTNLVGIFGGWDILGSDMRGMIKANDGNKYAITSRDAGLGSGALLKLSEFTTSLIAMAAFPQRPNGNGMAAHLTKIYGTYSNLSDVNSNYNMWRFDVSTGILESFLPENDTNGNSILPNFVIANNKLYARTLSGNSASTGYILEVDLGTLTVTDKIDPQSPHGSYAVGELLDLGNGNFLGFSQTKGSAYPGLANFEGNIVKYDMINNTVTNVAPLKLIPDGDLIGVIGGPTTHKASRMILASNGKVYFTYLSYGNEFYSVIIDSYKPQLILCELDLNTNEISIVNSTLTTTTNSIGIVSSVLEYEPGKLIYTCGDRVLIYNTNTNSIEFDQILIDSDTYGLAYGNTILASNGLIYGMTRVTEFTNQNANSIIYSLDPANNFFFQSEWTFDINNKEANLGLTEYNGKLYGSTSSTGANNHGYIFSFDLATSTAEVEYSFNANQDGAAFKGVWTLNNNKLYSTSFAGGQNGYGTLAEFDPGTSTLNVLSHLTLTNGRSFRGSPMVWDSTLSTDELTSDVKMKIFPNPVKHVLNIYENEVDLVNIYSISGQLLIKIKNSQTIKVENLMSGIYIIEIKNEKGTYRTKFIKQ